MSKIIKPDPTKALYIAWMEEVSEFVRWRYVGGGVTEPVMRGQTVERKARWSSSATAEEIAAALAYLAKERPEGYLKLVED